MKEVELLVILHRVMLQMPFQDSIIHQLLL